MPSALRPTVADCRSTSWSDEWRNMTSYQTSTRTSNAASEKRHAAARHYLLQKQRYAAREEREHQEKLAYVRAHEAALRDNRCPPALLHQLAAAYFGLLLDAEGDTPADRLRTLFRDDEGLTQAALSGLRRAILRNELPDLDEIIRLREGNREHYLALPALASLEELNRTTPDELRRLNTDKIRTALAFRFCTLGLGELGWYASILDSRPELVADALIQTATSEIRSGREYVPGLLDLACDPHHADARPDCEPSVAAPLSDPLRDSPDDRPESSALVRAAARRPRLATGPDRAQAVVYQHGHCPTGALVGSRDHPLADDIPRTVGEVCHRE